MIVYSIAFVFYVVDLANRSGDRAAALNEAAGSIGATRAATVRSASAEGASGGATATATLAPAPAADPAPGRIPSGSAIGGARGGASAVDAAPARSRSRSLRVGFSLTVLGFLLHMGATILRGIGAERVPWANMYEFALTATCAIVLVFLVVQVFVDLRFLGALITGLSVLFLGVTKINFYVEIVPLQPALDSYWLVIHILVAVLAVAFLTLSFGLSVLQLLQTRRENQLKDGGQAGMPWLRSMPDAVRLEDLAYRMAIIGFAFWTFTLIAGAIWAERAWSRYWGWDTKEVWTFVIWVLYAGFIHARATRGWRGIRSAWLSIIAYTAVIFNFTIVNVFFKGLHAYSGL
ncbi:c-type cytochrome biogenesis protein CcsB [Leucobacter sp. CSA1]|uniref:C-type cytochrome biogenesis protein CcsB n=1 Tax=Leucobacter chromiisoli TaxID=2796471 RepID=A0A934Q726_9MICO|nr:c-type cytochrome biogenesis protein CcsB [Leucobacter chromiisoli]MBK0419459.1 c-type cytochrome biogenesis protein CcsB [Leucobacter chromiisoli]